MNHDADPPAAPPWVRLAALGEQTGAPPMTLRRWAQRLPAEQAEKRPRDAGGQSEWWVRADAAAAFLRRQGNEQATNRQRTEQRTEQRTSPPSPPETTAHQRDFSNEQSNEGSNEQSNEHLAPAPSGALTWAPLETRLARIEGLVAGQWGAEWAQRLQELTAATEKFRQEAQQREERYVQELTTLREEARQREEEARQREAVWRERLEKIQEELRRPWWKRLRGR